MNPFEMQNRPRSSIVAAWVLMFGLLASASAHAHLMPAQRGTLSFVGDGAFMVLALPVSAFDGIDDDGDARMSIDEFGAHRHDILAAVKRDVRLLDAHGARALEGLMVSPSPPDGTASDLSTHVVVMGRFALADAVGPYRFEAALYGTTETERVLRIGVTERASARQQLLVLTPDEPTGALFPSSTAVFLDYAVLGAEHIVLGFDHLLFLLVVLAASRTPRDLSILLTTFTAGHAITLVASVQGSWSVPAGLVEPTIAATIVAVVAFDIANRARSRPMPAWPRVALVFACALVHGLGLSGAFGDLGLDAGHRLPSLAGFNVGIELGQVAVALAAWALVTGAHRLGAGVDPVRVRRAASFAAAALGAVWFVQRLVDGV